MKYTHVCRKWRNSQAVYGDIIINNPTLSRFTIFRQLNLPPLPNGLKKIIRQEKTQSIFYPVLQIPLTLKSKVTMTVSDTSLLMLYGRD